MIQRIIAIRSTKDASFQNWNAWLSNNPNLNEMIVYSYCILDESRQTAGTNRLRRIAVAQPFSQSEFRMAWAELLEKETKPELDAMIGSLAPELLAVHTGLVLEIVPLAYFELLAWLVQKYPNLILGIQNWDKARQVFESAERETPSLSNVKSKISGEVDVQRIISHIFGG